MRATPSRFSTFVASVDPNLEGRPTTLNGVRGAPAPSFEVPVSRPATLSGVRAATTNASALEQKHPPVVQAVSLLWGFPEMNQYFEKICSGGDPRVSLDPAAMAEVMLLSAIHQRICPYRPAKTIDQIYGTGHRSDPWKPARHRG